MIKYYYTCPIKALYMMKEFGVEFEIENEDFEDNDDGFAEPYFDFRLWEIEGPETINTLLDMLEDGGRIYVKYESRHIFEPKEGDIVDRVDPVPHEKFYKARLGDVKANLAGNWPLRIIMRDNKHFFMPEVEND